MSSDRLAFVSFERASGKFVGFLSIEGAVGSERDPEAVLREATKIYEQSVAGMVSALAEIETARASRTLIPARTVWRLGHIIFELKDELAKLGLQLDGMYEHLTRDLGVNQKWLEKVVSLRRYLPEESLIPESLNWGRCEKGTARIAQRLSSGLASE